MNTPQGWNLATISAVFALLVSAGSLVWNFALKDARDTEQDRAIARLEVDSRALSRMEISIAKIETKFEILFPTDMKKEKGGE